MRRGLLPSCRQEAESPGMRTGSDTEVQFLVIEDKL